jgi:hypothetical protein
MKSGSCAAACIVCLIWISFGWAQEIQVPVDSTGKILQINSELERELKLFPEFVNFKEAKLYQLPDSSYALEIFYKDKGETARDRRLMSADEVAGFRKHISELIARLHPQSALDQEGRSRLIATNLTLAMGYYGWAIPLAANMEGSGAVAGSYMIMSAAGFFIPYMVTENENVSKGDAWLSMYGGTRGIAHGIGFAYLVGGERIDDDEGRGLLMSGVVFSLAESWGGYALAKHMKMTDGSAATIGLLGDFGMLEGLGVTHLAGWLDHDNNGDHARAIAGTIIAGSAIGLVSGFRLTKTQEYTRGDASVLGSSAWLGALVPFAILDIADVKDDRTYTQSVMVGALFGLGIGNRLVTGKDFSTGQGRLIELAETAGALTGLGIATMADAQSSEAYTGLGVAGAVAGYVLMYRHLAPKADVDERVSWNFQIQPAGLMDMTMGKDHAVSRPTLPAATLEIRW